MNFKRILILAAILPLMSFGQNLTPVPNTGTTSTGDNLFPGFIREENGVINVQYDRVVAGSSFFARVNVGDGGFNTNPVFYDQAIPLSSGQMTGFQLPLFSGNIISDVLVDVFEVRGKQVFSKTQTIVQPRNSTPGLTVAAYETIIPSNSTPQTALKIIGSYDPSQPASIFLDYTRVSPKILSNLRASTPQEVTIALSDEITRFLGTRYLLTICQFGFCSTVTVQRLSYGKG